MEPQPAIAAIIEISVDADSDTYKTKSYIEVSLEYANDISDLPRDVLLSMVYELKVMSDKIMLNAEISESELKKYLKQRKLIEEFSDDTPSFNNTKKDEIDRSIDHLFDEDEDNPDN